MEHVSTGYILSSPCRKLCSSFPSTSSGVSLFHCPWDPSPLSLRLYSPGQEGGVTRKQYFGSSHVVLLSEYPFCTVVGPIDVQQRKEFVGTLSLCVASASAPWLHTAPQQGNQQTSGIMSAYLPVSLLCPCLLFLYCITEKNACVCTQREEECPQTLDPPWIVKLNLLPCSSWLHSLQDNFKTAVRAVREAQAVAGDGVFHKPEEFVRLCAGWHFHPTLHYMRWRHFLSRCPLPCA